MLSSFSRVCIKHISLRTLFLGIIVGLPLLIAACGSTGSSSSNTSAAPTDLITSGTLTVGSDTTYPPQEFMDTTTGKATGFDIDLITAMAKRMGLNVRIQSANFHTIIDDLSAKRYDVAISALTINNDRKQKVDFVPYFNSGESLLVQKGNPQHLQGVNDLCGKAVGVQCNCALSGLGALCAGRST